MSAALAFNFGSTISALTQAHGAGYEVGTEWSFMADTEHDITVWIARPGHTVLQLVDYGGRVLRTVAAVPGEYKTYAVIASENIGPVTVDETRGLPAAFSAALDYVTAPLRAARQHDHDPVAV